MVETAQDLTAEELFEKHAVDGQIPESVLDGFFDGTPEGEKDIEASPSPEAEKEELKDTDEADLEKKADGGEVEDGGVEKAEVDEENIPDEDKVVLAADGKHTIPYTRVTDLQDKVADLKQSEEAARELASGLKTLLEQRDDVIQGLQKSSTTEQEKEDLVQKSEALEEQLGDLKTDYPEAVTLIKEMQALTSDLKSEISTLKGEVSDSKTETAKEKHFRQIDEAHSDFDAVIKSDEFQEWMDGKPSIISKAYEQVKSNGNAQAVNEMLTTFKEETSEKVSTDDTVTDESEEEVEKKLKTPVVTKDEAPNSLTDVAGSHVQHDEKEKLLSSSVAQLEKRWEGMTPDQIAADAAKVI